MRVRLRPLPVMTAFALAALVLLVALGSWQWRRYDEKRLIGATEADAVSLAPFTPIPDAVQLVYGARDGKPGWRIFAPVRYGDVAVFVDAGYVAGAAPPDWRTLALPTSLSAAPAVTGIAVRPRRVSAFGAPPRPDEHVWHQIDLPAMAAASGATAIEPYYIAAPYIGPTGAAEPNPFAGDAARDPLPPERHLGYAVTWWGLAAALIGVYLAFHARAGRFVITR
jgi:surfeit locus 1 family protein